MRGISVGALRHRLTVERPARTDDGAGGAFVSWEPVAELWAALAPLSAAEAVVADQLAGRASHEIIVRYRSDLAPAMRFRLGSRLLSIVAILDADNRRRFVRCLCREDLL